MGEEGEGKIQKLYGNFTFHVSLCFTHHVHWWDGWTKEGNLTKKENSIKEENSAKEKDVEILIYSTLELALTHIGQTINGRKIVGIRVVKVEHHDTSVGVEDSPCVDTRISGQIDAGKEAVVEEEELKRLRDKESMSSETQVESVVDFASQDEEGVDWSEVEGQRSLGLIVASESSADGMVLEKMTRHSHDDIRIF